MFIYDITCTNNLLKNIPPTLQHHSVTCSESYSYHKCSWVFFPSVSLEPYFWVLTWIFQIFKTIIREKPSPKSEVFQEALTYFPVSVIFFFLTSKKLYIELLQLKKLNSCLIQFFTFCIKECIRSGDFMAIFFLTSNELQCDLNNERKNVWLQHKFLQMYLFYAQMSLKLM